MFAVLHEVFALKGARPAEVAQRYLAVQVYQDVVWLQVAVDHTRQVHVPHCNQEVVGQDPKLVIVKLTVAGQQGLHVRLLVPSYQVNRVQLLRVIFRFLV